MGGIRRAAVGVLVMLAALNVPSRSSAQELRLELKAGGAAGNYSETGAGLDLLPGPSFGALLEVWPTETLAAYVGLNRSSFGCEESLCTGRDVSLTSQGLVAGGRWSRGLPWVRAGLALHTLDVMATHGDEQSDPGLGFELAAGLEIPVWGTFHIRPGLSYLRHATSTDQGAGHVAVVALEVGGSVEIHSF